MIDGGGLAWKWTRKWVPASESRLAVSACEWPAGWPWPGRAPSAERVRGTTSVWRAGVVRDLCTIRQRKDGWLLSLFDHRSSTVPCARSLLQPHPPATRSQSRRVHIVPIPIGAANEGVWFRSCDVPLRPAALAVARSAAWTPDQSGQSAGRPLRSQPLLPTR